MNTQDSYVRIIHWLIIFNFLLLAMPQFPFNDASVEGRMSTQKHFQFPGRRRTMVGWKGSGFPADPCEGTDPLDAKDWVEVHNHEYGSLQSQLHYSSLFSQSNQSERLCCCFKFFPLWWFVLNATGIIFKITLEQSHKTVAPITLWHWLNSNPTGFPSFAFLCE